MKKVLQIAQLQKLVDALYMENIFSFRDHTHYTRGELHIRLSKDTYLSLPSLKKLSLTPYKITGKKITLYEENAKQSKISIKNVLPLIAGAPWFNTNKTDHLNRLWRESFDFIEKLSDSTYFVNNKRDERKDVSYKNSEWLSLLADRPFHPFAHAKGTLQSLIKKDNKAVTLHFWAFPENNTLASSINEPSQYILPMHQHRKLMNKLSALPITSVAIPLLPDQHAILSKEKATFHATDLEESYDYGYPTASLRTLLNKDDAMTHLKLPTNSTTLSAIRTMPPRYLKNSDQAQAFLDRLFQLDHSLSQAIRICDESLWWVVKDNENFLENTGKFGCQLRFFPKGCMNEGGKIMPMSALNTPINNPISDLAPDSWEFLKQLSLDFITVFLRFWHFGVMPECHGQNILLHFEDGDFNGFILRDHDSLRICPDQISACGLMPPNYQVNNNTPNTLILDDQTALLNYFITLGLQVTLYPIALNCIKSEGKEEADFWQWISVCIKSAIIDEPDVHLKELLEKQLLNAKNWPFKAVLGPLLTQSQPTTGMPSHFTAIENPLVHSI